MEVVGSDGSKYWSGWKVIAYFSLYGKEAGFHRLVTKQSTLSYIDGKKKNKKSGFFLFG